MIRVLGPAFLALTLGGCAALQELGVPTPSSTSSSATTGAASTTSVVAVRPQSAEQELLDVERRLAAEAQVSGLGAALAPALDPVDGFVIRPGVVYTGQDSVPTALGSSATGGPVFWQADRVFVSEGGDMGVTSGRYVQVVTGAEAIQGRYLVVWRRDATGQWKALTETRTPDPARPAPAPARRR